MEKTKSMFRTSAKELKTTFTLAVCAMLAALALILNSVASINIGPYVKIGFSGIPNQIADYLFGPITGCLFAGVLDIVKFFIRPDGPFFFGFTFNAMLAAFIYGCFYYKHKLTQGRFIISEKTEINYMQTKLIRLPSEEWHLPVEQIVHFNHLKRSGRKKRLFGIKENKMEYQYKLRPHHGLCISFFSVKKYSEKYKEHIKKIIAELENASIVCVTLQSDIFCEGCFSRLQDGRCSVADKVREYDQKILELCGWKEGMLLPYSEFKQAIHDNILSCRKCEIICGDCKWSKICYINERKNKKPICWINEQDKILSFHQEEGFVQKEFTDRDELRCFLLAVYGIYRVQ